MYIYLISKITRGYEKKIYNVDVSCISCFMWWK